MSTTIKEKPTYAELATITSLADMKTAFDECVEEMKMLGDLDQETFDGDPNLEIRFNEAKKRKDKLATMITDKQEKQKAHEARRKAAASVVAFGGSGGGGVTKVDGDGKNIDTKNNLDNDPNGGFKNVNEFLTEVRLLGNAARHGNLRNRIESDERLVRLSSKRAAESMGGFKNEADSTLDDLGAALLMPESMAPTVLKRDHKMPTFQTAQRTLDTPTVQFKYRVDHDHRESVTGGFVVGRKMELATATSSRSEYRSFSITAYTLFGVYSASEELIEWSPNTVIDEIEDGFETEFASQRLMELLNGKEQGEYQGVWHSPAKIVVDAADANNPVPTDFYAMEDRFWRGAKRDGVVYIAGNNMNSHLKNLQDTTGSKENTTFRYEPNAGPDWADGLLNNIPIMFSADYCPGLGFLHQIGLYDFSQYIEGFWRPMQGASSMHAKFSAHERVFKFWTYSGGHHTWERSLIPKAIPQGTSDSDIEDKYTLSPIVVMGGVDANTPKPNRPHTV